jgi:hypothetical protein
MSVKLSRPFDLVVHATHEAGLKVGGIGAVLDGLLGVRTYVDNVARTILVGPMGTSDAEEMARLLAPRNQLEIRYSSYHGVDEVSIPLSNRLHVIEGRYNVRVLYGTRAFGNARHEVILVDGGSIASEWVNAYKGRLYDRFGIQSDRYERDPEYSMHVNAAEPAYKALDAVLVLGDDVDQEASGQRFIVAHEFMGLPLCYSAMLHDPGAYRTIFYGHEVATVRPIVEFHPGHDTMFYNVLARAQQQGRYLEDVFGDQSGFFKHGLIRPVATHCDNIFAVGDQVVAEMRFLGADWARANIDLVYNGVPSTEITLDDKRASRNKLRQYCLNLLGYLPDYVFTHVTRFIPSKGLWRDIRVMEHLDSLLAEQNKRAILFVLSTVIPVGRSPKAITAMEAAYGWPVAHREATVHVDGRDVPDLVAHEIPFYRAIERFNHTARASKIVLVNQFGWSQDRCGWRMPADMTFTDIRHGSDVEFGQSTYEPFGIAQVEPLSAGALCVVSSACGCVGFVNRVGGQDKPNVIVADYVGGYRNGTLDQGVQGALSIDQAYRDRIESAQARDVARQIVDRLPQNDTEAQKLLEGGYAVSQKMSWEVVVRDYLLPGLARAMEP